ncbi:hypothetical protein [Haloprofundus sp. MHR1]|uniref:hypothetical protein n=1 Tax=Haloprofundus sp. MHR1 TaxID=2572921 RepID=UPI0010BECC8D|nr:hypothetical protein [Haloprofundus sp. MHR1]QCJ47225.1 hypothetical protein FCF25_08890 [Haloprofundus sp. MHR1]
MSQAPSEFHGHLIYQACKTHGGQTGEMLEDLVSSRPFTEDERPNRPQDGFEKLSFTSGDQFHEQRAMRVQQQLTGVRFREEQLGEEVEVYDSETDQRITGQPISEDTGDLLTTSSETLMIRSSKSTYQRIFDVIQAEEPAGGRLSQLSFDPDFMLWLFWQYCSGDSLSDLNPLSLTGAEFEGERSPFGRKAQVSDTTDIFSSTPVLLGLLSGQHFHSISGKFEYRGEFIDMNISREGRVHVKTTGQLAQLPRAERVLLASDAVNKTIKTYTQWVNRPPSSKYPPAEFFGSMLERLSDHGVEVRFSTDGVFRTYAERRGENFEEYTESVRDLYE